MSWASIGTDTGGSIRIPAAACGGVGLKPTFGEIPTAGVVPLSVSLDHVGPLTRTVSDAWAVYEVIKGVPEETKAPLPISRIELGKLGGYFLEQLDDDVRKRFEEALERLRSAGASVVDSSVDVGPEIATTYANIALPEASAYHAKTLKSMPEAYSEGVRSRLEMGLKIPADDYVRAQGERAILRGKIDAALAKCDALVLPTLPIPAPPIGATTVSIGGKEEALRPLMLRLTQLFSLTGHPAISLPCGDASGGLPCGLQLVGRHHRTPELLRLSLGCEKYVSPREHGHAGGR